MHRVSRSIALTLPFCFGAIQCTAQTSTPASPAPAASTTNIPANVQEVLVDLVARDKKGNLVGNLEPGDLQITDDGVPVKIKDLRYVNGGSSGGTAPHAQGGQQAQLMRVVSMVFENVGNESARLAREAADEMLKTAPDADVYFAVFQVSGRLRLLQPWTTDRAVVHRAVDAATLGARNHSNFDAQAAERTLLSSYGSSGNDTNQLLQGNASLGSTPMGGPSFAPTMIQMLQQSEQIARDQQARPSLAALLALSQQQSGLPGRKVIVYFCESLPLTEGTKEALSAVTTAANRSNVSVYTVDVGGLSTQNQTEAGNQMLATAAQASRYSIAMSSGPTVFNGPPQSGGGGSNPNTAPQGAQDLFRLSDRARDAIVSSSQSSLIDLARSTGGIYIGNSNDLRKPARRLMDNVASYYEASYVPESPKYDGRFHPLVVKVMRKDVSVQARNGYVALPPGTPADMQPWEASMLKYFSDANPPAQVEFRWRVAQFSRTAEGTMASLVIELPLRQLDYREDGNTNMFELHPTVLALLKDESGKVVHKFSQDLPYRSAKQAMEAVRDSAYTLQRSFTAKPGQYELEIAVSDALGGKVGVRRETVSIPSIRPGLGLSTVALVRRCESLPDTAAGELFRYRNVRVVPSLDERVSKEKVHDIPAFLVVYPDAASSAKTKLELELSWQGKSLGRFPLDLPAPNGAAIPYMASIPSGTLRPGNYELSAIVTQGTQVSVQKTTFTLEGPEPPAAEVAASLGKGVVAASTGQAEETHSAEDALPEGTLGATIAITPIENAAHPAPDEEKRILDIARQRALEYGSTIPNFTCIQKTRRLIDPAGSNKWRVSDNMTELLRYIDHEEVRQPLEANGVKIESPRANLRGFLSTGEFSLLPESIFSPEAKAAFTWKDQANIGNHPCHIFSFHVDAKLSKYALRAGPNGNFKRNVAFHGLVYIDSNSFAIRRISIEAENVPADFPIQASSMSMNYDVMQLGEHEYMLPVAAEVLARTGKRRLVRNEINFRDYRRFGSESTVAFH
ncbi:MAG TPA: VWA domain-containing protein [Bryobacteraceae bacterium]|nr:VWA domain-containing protein [Bryobacteraceae bacterium]